MPTLAAGSSITLTLTDNTSISLASNSGFATVSVVAVAGPTYIDPIGPQGYRRTHGPFKEGATVTITSTTAEVLYDGVTYPAEWGARIPPLVSGDWNLNQQGVIDAGGGLVVADTAGNLTGPAGLISGNTNQRYRFGVQCAPFGIPCNGTIAANGVVTLAAALRMVYDGGVWLWYPTGAVSGGQAGLYWTVMSSTTVGQVYTNYYNPTTAVDFPTYPSGGLVAAVGSGVAYVGPTAAVTVARYVMPANTLVPGDVFHWESTSTGTGTGNKIVTPCIEGVPVIAQVSYTSAVGCNMNTVTRLLPGAAQRQISFAAGYITNNGALFSNYDFSQARVLTYQLRSSISATEAAIVDLNQFKLEKAR